MVSELLRFLQSFQNNVRGSVADPAIRYVTVFDRYNRMFHVVRFKIVDDDLAVAAELAGNGFRKVLQKFQPVFIVHEIQPIL